MRVRALKTISTSRGSYKPGEIFEVDDGIAKRLLDANAIEMLDVANETQSLERELGKLKVDELRRLAEILDIETGDAKKADLVDLLAKNIPHSELEELEGLSASEIRAYLGE